MEFQLDTDNKEFQDALQLITHTRQSVFLTGKAGTGKSTFLKYICAHTKKKYVVLAPTGIAAINAEGVTLHSFFKLPFRPMLPDDPDLSLKNGRIFEFFKYRKEHRKLISEVELIIIDEISMVRADIIDCVDRILRVFSGNMRLPFGGKQLLFVGDVFQLEPVVPADQKEILSLFYASPFFFSARVFKDINLVPIELQKVYRQTDPVFINILDRIRSNIARKQELDTLNARYFPDFIPRNEDMYITLATRRDQVDFINERKLGELPGEEFVSHGKIEGDFPESSLPTQLNLSIKEQAQVIFIDNDYERRWVNGTIGMVSGIDENGNVYVLLEDGREYLVEPTSWRNYKYKYNEKEKKVEEEIAEFKQACAEGNAQAMELEFGDVLFTLVNVARKVKVDPESALRATCRKFRERWAFMEGAAWASGKNIEDLSMDELQELWDQAKLMQRVRAEVQNEGSHA